jgi:hypothetical protein
MQTLPIFLGLAIAWPLIIERYLGKKYKNPGIILSQKLSNPFASIVVILSNNSSLKYIYLLVIACAFSYAYHLFCEYQYEVFEEEIISELEELFKMRRKLYQEELKETIGCPMGFDCSAMGMDGDRCHNRGECFDAHWRQRTY